MKCSAVSGGPAPVTRRCGRQTAAHSSAVAPPEAPEAVNTASARRASHQQASHSALPSAPVSIQRDMSSLTSAAIARALDKSVDEISERRQSMRVAYQGIPGAFSEQAAGRACPELEPLPCEQFETAFQALSQWMADRACLPVENSLGGSIHTVYDLLLRYNVHIVGEKYVPISHCLLANPGVQREDLKRVLSHPQALAQCDDYLRELNVVKEAVDDTAGAANLVAKQQMCDVGAIASERAAELYGLNILDRDIQDLSDNVTRFIVLSREPPVATETVRTGSDSMKTSLVFSLTAGPGSLFKALACFALRDLDMSKIESRPLRTKPLVVSRDGESKRLNYLFYVDVLGSMADPNMQKALGHLQEVAPFLRVLGSYPADVDFLQT